MSNQQANHSQTPKWSGWFQRQRQDRLAQRGDEGLAGDSISTGDITASKGVAIGRGAIAAAGKNIIVIAGLRLPHWLALAILLVLGTGVVVGGINYLNGRRTEANTRNTLAIVQATATPTATPTVTPTPTLTPTPQPMLGRFNIAVAKFSYQDAEGNFQNSLLGSQLSYWLAENLHTELSQGASKVDFLVWHDQLNRPPSNPEIGYIATAAQAKTLLLETNIRADLVIFGHLEQPNDPTKLELQFVYRDPKIAEEPDGDLGRQRFGGAIPIPAGYREKLANADEPLYLRTQAVVWLARGLAKEFAGQYEDALALFKGMETRLQGWNDGREILYYFQGREAFYLRRLDDAERSYERALEVATMHGRNYASASIGLGNVYLERAQLRLMLETGAGEDVAACSVEEGEAENLLTYIQAAQQAGNLSATREAMIADSTKALDFYRQAVAETEAPDWEPVRNAARYMLATGLQVRSDIYLLHEAVSEAEADANEAIAHFAAAQPRFEDDQEYGFLAYTLYGLGMTRRILANINEQRGDYAQARDDYEATLTNLALCQQYKERPDADGDHQLQARAACYCGQWQRAIEQHVNEMPQDDGRKG